MNECHSAAHEAECADGGGGGRTFFLLAFYTIITIVNGLKLWAVESRQLELSLHEWRYGVEIKVQKLMS